MYFLLHMGYAPHMTQFNVGDKVQRQMIGAGAMQPGTKWTVINADGRYIQVQDENIGSVWYGADNFSLVEPAEIEQATAILDKTKDDDGWWDLSWTDRVVLRRWVEEAKSFGLEVRVQARRKSAGS